MLEYTVLKEYYVRYLRDVRGSKTSTINHYIGALSTISKYLVKKGKIKESIYEINDVGELEVIKEFLFGQIDFMEKDARGNQMYSSGLNNYIRFAKGEEFCEIGKKVIQLDVKVPVAEQVKGYSTKWKRNSIIKTQSIELANYMCEVDPTHKTFTSERTQKQYMEGHHAIPLKEQGRFNSSLDVYSNIVCLCPVCHRLLHYGIASEKEPTLGVIYASRAERLSNSGIKLSKDEFMKIVC